MTVEQMKMYLDYKYRTAEQFMAQGAQDLAKDMYQQCVGALESITMAIWDKDPASEEAMLDMFNNEYAPKFKTLIWGE